MHYQHRYHAGNFADVFKHALLVALVDALNAKSAPWCYVDTHSGAGLYALHDEAALRSGEAEDGILRLADPVLQTGPLVPYLQRVQAFNPSGKLLHYPGSPALVAEMARAQDRLILCEKVPAVAGALSARFATDARVAVHRRDGYEAVSLLPPREKRGLVLVDPPFERADEFDAMTAFATAAMARFASGVYAFWYPYKNRHATEHWLRRMRVRLTREAVNCVLHTGAHAEGQMRGCGLLVVNPPYAFTQALDALLPALASALGQGRDAQAQAALWPTSAAVR